MIYGYDSSLLDIRAALVRRAGFNVLCAYTRSQVEQMMDGDSIDVFILCHTISVEEDQALLLKASSLQPQMKTLVLIDQRNQFIAKDVAIVDVWKGSAGLQQLNRA